MCKASGTAAGGVKAEPEADGDAEPMSGADTEGVQCDVGCGIMASTYGTCLSNVSQHRRSWVAVYAKHSHGRRVCTDAGEEAGNGPEAVPESAAEVAAEAAASAATQQSGASGVGADMARLQLSSADSGGGGATATSGHVAVKSEPVEDDSAAGDSRALYSKTRCHQHLSCCASGGPVTL